MGLRYLRRAGSGGSWVEGGRRSSVKGGVNETRERVRYSSREMAGAVKFVKERAAKRMRAMEALRFDFKADVDLGSSRRVVTGTSASSSLFGSSKEGKDRSG